MNHLRLTSYLNLRGVLGRVYFSVCLSPRPSTSYLPFLCLSSFFFLLPLKPLFISDVVPLSLLLFVMVSLSLSFSPFSLTLIAFCSPAFGWSSVLLSLRSLERRCQGICLFFWIWGFSVERSEIMFLAVPVLSHHDSNTLGLRDGITNHFRRKNAVSFFRSSQFCS